MIPDAIDCSFAVCYGISLEYKVRALNSVKRELNGTRVSQFRSAQMHARLALGYSDAAGLMYVMLRMGDD